MEGTVGQRGYVGGVVRFGVLLQVKLMLSDKKIIHFHIYIFKSTEKNEI